MTCQHCTARSQHNLCNQHTQLLIDLLNEYPRMLTHLAETHYNQTTNYRLKPGSPPARQQASRRNPSPNSHAAHIETQTHDTLANWALELCRTQRLTYKRPQPVTTDFIGPLTRTQIRTDYTNNTGLIALWLAQHRNAIQNMPRAGNFYTDINKLASRIEQAVNRPQAPIYLGPCPATINNQRCNNALIARKNSKHPLEHVRCKTCGTQHAVKDIINDYLKTRGHLQLPAPQLLLTLEMQGQRLPESTFYKWRNRGYIQPSQLLDDGTELYRLADIHHVRTTREHEQRRAR